MPRLTKKFKDDSGYTPIENHTGCNITLYNFNLNDYDHCVDKLGRLEDLEEELDCPFEVIGKVLLDWGFVDKDGGVQITGMKIDGDGSKYFIAVNGDLYDLKDYKKTWWLQGDKYEVKSMSRIPEFRAWLIKEKKMVYGIDLILDSDKICYLNEIGEDEIVYFVDIELMEGVGIKDKNKKKIFEGDIVQATGFKALVVVWDNNSCGFKLKYSSDNFENLLDLTPNKAPLIEVIGNIYENPELLEV